MKIKHQNFIWFICGLVILLSAGTCDHTRLSGTLELDKSPVYVDDTVDMKLILPGALQNVHGVMWHVEPADYVILDSTHLGHSAYEQIDGDYRVTDSSDRNARFVPLKPGDYTIYVDGFFKQTNPQPIVEKTLTVKPKK